MRKKLDTRFPAVSVSQFLFVKFLSFVGLCCLDARKVVESEFFLLLILIELFSFFFFFLCVKKKVLADANCLFFVTI